MGDKQFQPSPGRESYCANCGMSKGSHTQFGMWGHVTFWCREPDEDKRGVMSKDSPVDRDENDAIDKNSPGIGDTALTPQLAPAPVTRKLDLACGQSPRDGFEGVDIFVGAQHVVDLQRYPWPFADNSVLELNCSHYIEHIPMEMVGMNAGAAASPYKDALFAFFDECYRILVPDGWLHLQWPAHSSSRAFQDPTHRRFIPSETMYYMNQAWRKANRLDHYNVECNFIGSCDPIVDASLMLRSAEVVSQNLKNYWNATIDFVAKLQKKPRE